WLSEDARGSSSWKLPRPISRAAARFSNNPAASDESAAVDTFDHVDDGECRDINSGQSFHFHSRAVSSAHSGFDKNVVLKNFDLYFGTVHPNRVGERQQFWNLFRRSNTSDTSYCYNIALRNSAFSQCLQHLSGTRDFSLRGCRSHRGRLFSDIHHVCIASIIEMGKFHGHPSSFSVGV